MDNINVIRIGFFAPVFKIPDVDGDIGDPIDRSQSRFTCLAFVNADDAGAGIIRELEGAPMRTASGLDVVVSGIVPSRIKPAKEFKNKTGFETRLFCDSDLRVGRMFSIVASGTGRPAYHPCVFVIGEEGSVRYRQAIEFDRLEGAVFRKTIGDLI